VDIHGNLVLAAKTLGHTEVITVPMGENQSSDIGEAPTHRLQFVAKLSPMTGKSSIDHGDACLVLDQIAGHDVGSDAVEVRGKLHSYRGGGSRASTAAAQSSGSSTLEGRLINRR
jgi:hypothetical protein